MQWMVPEHRLDEFQREILRACTASRGKNHWIKGFAGSGKSVLLVYAVQKILAAEPNKRVCVAVYTHALKQLLASGLPAKFRGVPVNTYHQLLADQRRGQGTHYDVLVVDEVQDIPKAELQALASMADRLVVAGDGDQRIYQQSSSNDEIADCLQPENHALNIIYRLTKRVIDIVKTVLPDSPIFAARTSRMLEVQVTLAKAEDRKEEADWVWAQCCHYSKSGEPSAILLPSHREVQALLGEIAARHGIQQLPLHDANKKGRRDYDLANECFRQHRVPIRYLGNDFGDLEESDSLPLTYVMTYHSAKGLDFNTVFVPRLNNGLAIWRDDDDIARRMFFVAVTRSRRNLFLSYSSNLPHAYVQGMPQGLLHMEACAVRDDAAGDEDIPF
jgi:hypothetical protein